MNKKKFIKSLDSLVGWRETAFILAMAERALPNLKLYLESREEGAPEVPDISVSWQAAIFEPDESEVVEVLDAINALEQWLEDDENYGALPSRDCLFLWEQALLSSLNNEKRRAKLCSQKALETITDFLEFSEGEGLSDNALIKLFEQHPLVEREFSFQTEQDELLRSAKHPSEPFVKQLRILAQDEGVSNIGIALD